MAEDKELYLENMSRHNLNKMVQRELYSELFKNFSSYLNNMSLRGNLGYDKVLTQIQNGLFGEFGYRLKETKNIPLANCLPDYMSPNELIMYREAIQRVMEEYDYMQTKTGAFGYYYGAAERIGDEVYKEFSQYKRIQDERLRKTFYDNSGVNIKSGVVKYFNKALRCGNYNKVLSITTLRNDNITNTLYENHKFDPLSDKNFDRYQTFRKNFVKVVKYCKDNDINESQTKNLFRIYEATFYNTEYLKENNIDAINYLLGLSKGVYFSSKNLSDYENEMKHFKECIDNNIKDYSKIRFYLSKTAQEERNKYIENNYESFGRPETSNVFLVACLDNIVKNKIAESKKESKTLLVEKPEDAKFSTKNIQNLPESIIKIAKMVILDISEKDFDNKYENLKKDQPSFFDLGFIPEINEQPKPSTNSGKDNHCQ